MRCLSMLEYLLAAQADHLKLSTRAQGGRRKRPLEEFSYLHTPTMA